MQARYATKHYTSSSLTNNSNNNSNNNSVRDFGVGKSFVDLRLGFENPITRGVGLRVIFGTLILVNVYIVYDRISTRISYTIVYQHVYRQRILRARAPSLHDDFVEEGISVPDKHQRFQKMFEN